MHRSVKDLSSGLDAAWVSETSMTSPTLPRLADERTYRAELLAEWSRMSMSSRVASLLAVALALQTRPTRPKVNHTLWHKLDPLGRDPLLCPSERSSSEPSTMSGCYTAQQNAAAARRVPASCSLYSQPLLLELAAHARLPGCQHIRLASTRSL
jgi:hypothetical protein